MNPPLLEVEDLRIRFPTPDGHVQAVHGISFGVQAREIVGLVGESGAGKSLTGMALLGLVDPPAEVRAQAVRIAGRRIDNLPARALRAVRGRDIGVIFQDPLTSLDPLFTVKDQLVETIRCHLALDADAAAARALDLLRQVGIPAPERRMNDYPHQLSGGMRQRVVIALALAADPKLIVADEPTTALDVSIQAQIIGLIRRLCDERGTGILLITHDMGVIAEIADRVAVMYAGRIIEIGPTASILRNPQHPYTRGLIGAIPSIGGPRGKLTHIKGAMPRPGFTPPGCSFAPRCERALPRCRGEAPELVPGRDGVVACFAPIGEAVAC
jgi:peptide/nickel transport system ATP-binding protein